MQAWKNGLGTVIDHTPQLAASKPAVKPRHTPSFVVEWVERWLGPDEIRHIICAAVGLNDFAIDGAGGEMPPEMLLDLSTEFVKYAAGVIQESGGVILEQRPTQIVACWGYPSANLAGMSLALKAIETIVQSDQWKGRAGAAIDAGSALIQPLTLTAQEDIRSDHPKIGKRGIRVSSILVERTSRLLPTTRPGEIAILPTAHALIPDSTTSTHLAPLRSGMLPDGL